MIINLPISRLYSVTIIITNPLLSIIFRPVSEVYVSEIKIVFKFVLNLQLISDESAANPLGCSQFDELTLGVPLEFMLNFVYFAIFIDF